MPAQQPHALKAQQRKSRLFNDRQVNRRRPAPSTSCSCTEARRQRDKAAANEMNPLNQLPDFKIPEPLQIRQDELCTALERAVLTGGETGAAARKLQQVLQPHLLKEETDLLQPLGLLLPLARGDNTPAMRQVLSRTEHLKARMFEIVREHAEIIEAAQELLRVARAERKLALAAFTERLMLRAWTDEVVFYPAAVLIGEYLKLRFPERTAG